MTDVNIAIHEMHARYMLWCFVRFVCPQVRLTRDNEEQSTAVDMMTKQHTILIQKKLRIEADITAQRAETVGIEKEIHHLQVDLSKLDSLLYRERGSENLLQQENQLLETQFMASLKVWFIAQAQSSVCKRDTRACLNHITWRIYFLNPLVDNKRLLQRRISGDFGRLSEELC
jgi:hypothetical protein